MRAYRDALEWLVHQSFEEWSEADRALWEAAPRGYQSEAYARGQ